MTTLNGVPLRYDHGFDNEDIVVAGFPGKKPLLFLAGNRVLPCSGNVVYQDKSGNILSPHKVSKSGEVRGYNNKVVGHFDRGRFKPKQGVTVKTAPRGWFKGLD